MKWGINGSKTSFERKTRPWSTLSFTVAATHYAIVESSSSTLLFFLICIHSPSNIALTSKFRLQHKKRLMVSHRFYCDQSLLHLRALHLLLFITKEYAYICAKNLINNTQIHSFSLCEIYIITNIH